MSNEMRDGMDDNLQIATPRRTVLKGAGGLALGSLGLGGRGSVRAQTATPAAPAASPTASGARPNILFILADNIGYGDIGCLRRRRVARRADAAHRSTRRRRSAADAVSGRAGLHTVARRVDDGALFHPLGAVAGRSSRASPTRSRRREITMAEMLHDAGYATAIFGKWHLGAQPYSQPQNKGFDEFYGIPPGDTWDAFLMIPPGPSDQVARDPARQGAADRRGQTGRAAARGEALHRARCGATSTGSWSTAASIS